MGLLTDLVLEIRKNPQHLSGTDIAMLAELIPNSASSSSETPTDLGALLQRLTKMSTQLYDRAVSSDDADELKVAANALKQALDVSVKYSDKIAASDRAIKIENALIEAVKSYGDKEFQKVFLRHLRKHLTDATD